MPVNSTVQSNSARTDAKIIYAVGEVRPHELMNVDELTQLLELSKVDSQ